MELPSHSASSKLAEYPRGYERKSLREEGSIVHILKKPNKVQRPLARSKKPELSDRTGVGAWSQTVEKTTTAALCSESM